MVDTGKICPLVIMMCMLVPKKGLLVEIRDETEAQTHNLLKEETQQGKHTHAALS